VAVLDYVCWGFEYRVGVDRRLFFLLLWAGGERGREGVVDIAIFFGGAGPSLSEKFRL